MERVPSGRVSAEAVDPPMWSPVCGRRTATGGSESGAGNWMAGTEACVRVFLAAGRSVRAVVLDRSIQEARRDCAGVHGCVIVLPVS